MRRRASSSRVVCSTSAGRLPTEVGLRFFVGGFSSQWGFFAAGSVIAFHFHSDDLLAGDTGVICSFGAGYSIGSVIVRKL